MLLESIKMSWSNITHNKLRSFLTMLGIVIGVASIIALITIVQGATESVTSQVAKLGADKLTVTAPGTALKKGLTEGDLARIAAVSGVSGISPTVSGSTSVVVDGSVDTGVSVKGENEVYFNKNAGLLASGRMINILDIDQKSRVAVIGSGIAQDLFYGVPPVGRDMLINGITYTVVGLLSEQTGFSINSTNNSVLIPYTSAMSTLGVNGVTSLDVYMSDTADSDQIVSDVKAVLNEAFNYHDGAYSVFNMQDIISTIGQITGMMSLLLAGIASISLIVGGIGIMNMMLVSVTERTAEIGLRKALGAEPSRIQLQFLIESIFISLIGGAIGMLLGTLIALVAASVIGIPFTFSASTVFLSFGFSAAVGVIFGIAPARKASRLNPIDALRHE